MAGVRTVNVLEVVEGSTIAAKEEVGMKLEVTTGDVEANEATMTITSVNCRLFMPTI